MARYLYGDHCSTDLRSFIPNVNAQQAIDDSATGVTAHGVTGFGKGLAGQIYFTAQLGGLPARRDVLATTRG